MKKFTAVLLIIAFLFLCACGNEPDSPQPVTEAAPKRSDVLYLNDTSESYLACLGRYYAVVSALNNKVRTLEEEHNKAIKAESTDKFFLEENYIQLTGECKKIDSQKRFLQIEKTDIYFDDIYSVS